MRRTRQGDRRGNAENFLCDISHAPESLFAQTLRERNNEHVFRDESAKLFHYRRKKLAWRRQNHDVRAIYRLFGVGFKPQRLRQLHAGQKLGVFVRAPHFLHIFRERPPERDIVSISRKQQRVGRSPAAVADYRYLHQNIPPFTEMT